MKNTTTIVLNEEVCTIDYSKMNEPVGSRSQKHTTLHVSCPFDPEEVKHSGFTKRPDYSLKGDNKELDKEWRRYNKAELLLQRRIIAKAVADGMIPEQIIQEAKWSRKAGCSCGCSPGWIIRDYGRKTMWLTCTAPSKEREKEERKAAYRAEQEAKTLASMVI